MSKCIKYATWAPVALLLLGSSYCSDNGAPPQQTAALEALNGNWKTSCLENPRDESIANSVIGYYDETLQINGLNASLTFNYYQDPECSLAVTAEQVVNPVDQRFTLQSQSKKLSLSFPFGTTSTDLGSAQHINLLESSVMIDGETLSESELQERSIELDNLLGIFVITPSDRLHIATTNTNSRPTTVPFDYFYTRSLQ